VENGDVNIEDNVVTWKKKVGIIVLEKL